MTDDKQMAVIEMRDGVLTPLNFEGLYRLAKIMSASGMMPKGMEVPEKVFVAIQMGLEVGLSPMAAVQNIASINGRPTIWGDAMLGLVRASGQLESIEETQTEDAATCTVVRNGEKPITRTFTKQDAQRAGLLGKQGPWTQYPKRMLQMRARAFALRDGFSDVLKGLYMREEMYGSTSERDITAESSRVDAHDLGEQLKADAQSAMHSADMEMPAQNEPVVQPEPKDTGKADSRYPLHNQDMGVDVDIDGVPWNPDFHAASRECTSAGRWRMRRGHDPAAYSVWRSDVQEAQRKGPPEAESGGTAETTESESSGECPDEDAWNRMINTAANDDDLIDVESLLADFEPDMGPELVEGLRGKISRRYAEFGGQGEIL